MTKFHDFTLVYCAVLVQELLVQDMRLPWFSTFWGLLNHVVICCHKSQASWIMLSHFNMFQSCIALVTVVLSIALWVTSLQVMSTKPIATKSFPEYSAAPGPSVCWFIDVYWCLLMFIGEFLGMGVSEVTGGFPRSHHGCFNTIRHGHPESSMTTGWFGGTPMT